MQGILDDPEYEGIIPRIVRYLFERIKTMANSYLEFVVKISIVEIYNEKIRDLINLKKNNLQIREEKSKGIFIENLSELNVASSIDVLNIMKKGLDNRAVNSTNMNEQSSRSHSIIILNIKQNNLNDLSAKLGKLYLVDLAGSEKISKTGAAGLVLDEAKSINKSLTTLGIVINALTESKQSHIPYRDSKLTRVLQESLGGNSKTCLIITCSPSTYNEAETLSTLRFGMRAKKVKNSAKINKEYSIQELKSEVNKLEGQLGHFKSRVSVLEEFLLKYGLPLPDEDLKEFPEIIIVSNKSKTNFKDLNDVDTNVDTDKKSLLPLPLSIPLQSPSLKSLTCNDEDKLNITVIDEENMLEINKTCLEVLNLVKDMENDKNQIEDELSRAVEKVEFINMDDIKKDYFVNELNLMKTNSENKIFDMKKEIDKMRKFIERNKSNLSFVAEVEKETENDNPGFKENDMMIKIDDENFKLDEYMKTDILSNFEKTHIKNSNSKVEDEINLLSTNPFSREINPDNNSESMIFNSQFKKNNSYNNYCDNTNKFMIEELINQLKSHSDKLPPEINNLIKDKFSSSKSEVKSNSSNSNIFISNKSDVVYEKSELCKNNTSRQNRSDENFKTNPISNEKNKVLIGLENKVENILFKHINTNTQVVKETINDENFRNHNLKNWKERYRNIKK